MSEQPIFEAQRAALRELASVLPPALVDAVAAAGPTEQLHDLGVQAASLEDLACMKLSAIAGRGKARDFWDLSAILERVGQPLDRFLDAYRLKYRQEDIGHVVRSLAYFADADAEPLPQGLTPEGWAAIKNDLRQRVLALGG